MSENILDIIEDTDVFLKRLFARVTLHSPYYEQARVLQRDIAILKQSFTPADKSKVRQMAISLRKQGLTIRAIAKAMGYKNPGSISHLLKK